MRRFFPLLVVAALVGGAGLYFFKRELVMEKYEENALGFPAAKTPEKCAELFNKAIKDRNYKMLAKYCTREYAELLVKANDAGRELGKSIDDVTYRMEKDGVMTPEITAILFLNDPLPKMVVAAVQSSSADTGLASLTTVEPSFDAARTGKWDIDMSFVQGFYAGQPGQVKMIREGGVWKMDIPVTDAVRARFVRVLAVHKDYVNALNKMSEEVRTERTTKFDVTKRLKELLNHAVRNNNF